MHWQKIPISDTYFGANKLRNYMYVQIHIHIVPKLSWTRRIAKTSTGEMETYVHACLGATVQLQAQVVFTSFNYSREQTVHIIDRDRKNGRKNVNK
jgi:hypothetical protein